MSDEKPTKDELFRIAAQGTFQEFVEAATKYFDQANTGVWTDVKWKAVHKEWAEWHANPYKKGAKPAPPPLKNYMVTFSRIGSDPDWRGWRTIVKAPELGATIAPIHKIVNDIFEDEYEIPQANLQVTLVEDKGQINFGLLGEFTVVEMPS